MADDAALLMAAVGVVSLYRYWWPDGRGLIGVVWAVLTCLLVASVHRLSTARWAAARWAAACLGLVMAVVAAVMYVAAAVLATAPP